MTTPNPEQAPAPDTNPQEGYGQTAASHASGQNPPQFPVQPQPPYGQPTQYPTQPQPYAQQPQYPGQPGMPQQPPYQAQRPQYYAQPAMPNPAYGYPQPKSKIAAGLLGIFLGGLGIHRFYLGYTTIGVIQLVLFFVTGGIASLWGFVEGIMILAGATYFQRDAQGIPLRD